MYITGMVVSFLLIVIVAAVQSKKKDEDAEGFVNALIGGIIISVGSWLTVAIVVIMIFVDMFVKKEKKPVTDEELQKKYDGVLKKNTKANKELKTLKADKTKLLEEVQTLTEELAKNKKYI